MVAQVPSAAKADEFIDKQTEAWQGCVDEVVTSKDKGGTETWQERTTAVDAHPGVVIASSITLPTEQPCKHILQAMANVILEVSVCSDDPSDQAETIVSKLAERVRAG
jgi:serine/threonine-protein kinase